MKEEEKNRTSKITKLQQFFRKRWVFPAIYLTSAVVVLTAVLWYQSASNNDVKDQLADDGKKSAYDNRDDAVEVGKPVENVAMPVADSENVSVVKKFFETDATKEEKEAALVNYNNTYSMSKGIDLAEKDGKTFDVSASLSGTVIKAAKDPVLGYVVEVEHEDGLSTVYQSLSEVSVKQGDKIEQNQVIGKAGKNLYNEEGGNHVHFEIRKDGVALNPLNFMDKPVSSIEKAVEEQAAEMKEPAQPSVEEKPKTEDKTKDQTGGKDDKTKREDSSEGSENQDGTQSDDSSQS
ncbi:peptidoglycan DD-metalloendopeptidase family protein [Bacillus sp. GM2]|uniref:M23 family metallopeptidase n=1 Tax=Bacillus TaxID=1386 RepID=UPI000951677E|nr:M23 family metallopeptidase [Bacillus paralicheniformis]MSN98718.1 peptidoglycan DD-metalloendopeptidase family protein [Bacillus paralicheniformis]MSO02726.1 peptidoglycan DD-metalloendopeptidase family protein [Bacillus paralicheniformis]MSO06719.1 peptidoglycan DD-metalloendopeptidase family protein [Bacillus paralicheniformis]MSO10713.1 peptidoglycan DD-metalloendopeptidase family protein [Bacillus paralicheniformis]NJE36203.1 M23 family metallopeptidase [Bacillus paralicheniformis]